MTIRSIKATGMHSLPQSLNLIYIGSDLLRSKKNGEASTSAAVLARALVTRLGVLQGGRGSCNFRENPDVTLYYYVASKINQFPEVPEHTPNESFTIILVSSRYLYFLRVTTGTYRTRIKTLDRTGTQTYKNVCRVCELNTWPACTLFSFPPGEISRMNDDDDGQHKTRTIIREQPGSARLRSTTQARFPASCQLLPKNVEPSKHALSRNELSQTSFLKPSFLKPSFLKTRIRAIIHHVSVPG
jgi:hypothetical protein